MTKQQSHNNEHYTNNSARSIAVDTEHELLLTIINSCGGSIYIVQNDKIVFHNPQFNALTGFSSEEITQMDFIDLVHFKDKKLIKLLFSSDYKEISQKKSRSYTFRAVNKNGEMRWFKSNVSLITWNNKPALLDNCFDITQQKEFEQKLVEEEQNFRLLVNAFEDMVFIISRRGVVVQANRSVFNRLAYKEHEVLLKHFSGFHDEEKRDEVKKLVSDAFFGKRVLYSGHFTTKKSKVIPVEVRLFKGNWSQKEVVFAICQDVSARIEAERIIKMSEEKFSKAFDNNAVMMTISTFEDGRYIDVNETFLSVTGYSRDQVIGKTSAELTVFSEINRRDELKNLILSQGRARDIETEMTNSEGKRIVCNFSTELVEIQGKSCLLAVLSDITQRKEAERKILLSEQRFRQLGELLPEKVFEADSKGRITFANNYLISFFGIDPAELEKGVSIVDLFSKKSQKTINEYLKTSKKVIELPSIELVAKKSNGEEFPALTHIIAVVEKGIVNRFMGVMVDISARKEQEMELVKAKNLAEHASKAKEQFLSTMSHEIRTPMNAVIGMANILLQENPKKHQLENLQTLKFAAEGLMGLLNDILDFSKIDAGKLIVSKLPFNLKTLSEGVYSVHKHIASSKGIDLALNFDSSIPETIYGDSVRINQVLTNLTANAIKFTEEGKVVINVKLLKETKTSVSVFFSIVDSGIGIPYDKQKAVFQEFTQANHQTTRKYGGTGLGLSISKRIVSLLKGDLKLKSHQGKGSEFYFTICFRKRKSEKKINTEKKVELPVRPGKPYKILVVEDNEVNSYIAMKFLKSWGIETEHAENGAIAIDMLQKDNFDLILMDLEMPVMSGYDATVNIRNLPNPNINSIPIIALTASAMLDVQTKIFNLGMNGFILKPFNPNDLKEKIATLLK